MSSTPSSTPIQQLSEFSACEISDALIKLGSPSGGHIPDIRLILSSGSDQTICGPAYTVQMVFSSDTGAPRLSSHFIDTAPAGTIIVINAPHTAKNAVWGGLMSAGAQARKTVGAVISGRCRDIQEHNSLGYPVFARGHSTLGQSPFTRPSAVNVPVEIDPRDADGRPPAVTVHPGDYIVGDVDGVVCVPQKWIQQVVKTARRGKEVDERCMEDIKAGNGVQVTFKAHRG